MAVQRLQRHEAACGAWKEENVMSCRQVNRTLEHYLFLNPLYLQQHHLVVNWIDP